MRESGSTEPKVRSAEDVDRQLELRHRDAMLDLVLTWGSLDGALGMLLTRMRGLPMHEGPDALGSIPSSAKFEEMRRLLKLQPDGHQAATKLRRYKKRYERYSTIRNVIAHSRCAGILKIDRDYIVFATFQRAGDDGLAVDVVPIQEMHRAHQWGEALLKLFLELIDSTEKLRG